VVDAADRKMAEKAANYGPEIMRMAEKSLLLQLLDQTWKDHLLSLDHLRQGINLRAYAQRDPLNEYKREAFELFETMLAGLRETVTSVLCHVELRVQRGEEALPQPAEAAMAESESRATGTGGRPVMASAGGFGARTAPMGTASGAAAAGVDPRTPRNAACPCGSGKKYKHCHGRV
jgi:preprotein translocase subunit SecA